MTAASVKNDPIKSDRMKFQTQIVNGKPQIFFDAIDNSTTKTNKSKRTSRMMSNGSRLVEQHKSKSNNQKPLPQNATNRPTKNVPIDEDGSSLGVYMTMDEIAELVKAVKENAKNENHTTTETTPVKQQQQQHEVPSAPVVPKLELPVDPPAPAPVTRVSPREQALSIMAEKKRQKWMRDKAEIERMQLEIEYDQLKHQLSPRQKQNSVSPERSTFQYDFPSSQAPPVTSKPPTGFKQTEVSPKVNDDSNLEALKTRLMEKKQQQWQQENSEKMPTWNPFGRPGAGAPNPAENSSRISQPYSNNTISYRPLAPSLSDNSLASQSSTFAYSDQTQVPAAMRRNLFFGDVRFEDDVRTAKEIERRQWLDDLQKQIEDNKRQKLFQYETDRRKDFLNESVQPIVQEAANRQQQLNNSLTHDAQVQQTYEKMLEANNAAKYEKRLQLIEKLKRSGHQTDQLVKTLSNGKSTNETTGEKLFGPTYESASQQNHQTKYDSAYLSNGVDEQHSYRPPNRQRDETVNTVDTTFRSEHSVPPRRQAHPYAQEDSELPPQTANPHYQNFGYRNVANQPGKNNIRMRSHEDANSARRTSTATYQSNGYDDGHVSQISNQRSHHGPVDMQHRPLWNYNNPEHREYVPNSKRDPHYERRQRLKHFEQGNFDRIDDVQKKTCYNRWNSDTDLQQQRKKSLPPTNRVRSTISKTSNSNSHKDESILNLLKLQNRHQQESFAGARKSVLNHYKNDEENNYNHESAFEKHDNYPPYTQTDHEHEQVRSYSPVQHFSEPSPAKKSIDTNMNQNNSVQQDWDDTTNRQPQSRQEHILQQLSAIKENLVRRQRELASSMNVIPV